MKEVPKTTSKAPPTPEDQASAEIGKMASRLTWSNFRVPLVQQAGDGKRNASETGDSLSICNLLELVPGYVHCIALWICSCCCTRLFVMALGPQFQHPVGSCQSSCCWQHFAIGQHGHSYFPALIWKDPQRKKTGKSGRLQTSVLVGTPFNGHWHMT